MSSYNVSVSKVNTWRRCPKKWSYKYVDKLEPRRRSRPLELGSWVHSLLEAHYSGEDWKSIHKSQTKAFYNLYEEARDELGDLPSDTLNIMRRYLRHWKAIDANFVTVDTELNEYVELPNGVRLQIIVDQIVEDKRTRLLWARDHKNRKSFSSKEGMILDPQLTVYFAGLQRLGYTPLGGVEYNELRTKLPTVPEVLKSGQLSKKMKIDTDVFTYLSAIRTHGLDVVDYSAILRHIAKNESERFFRRIKLPKDPPMVKAMMRELGWSAAEMQRAEQTQHFPRTFDKDSCKWGCDFKDLCIAQLHGADVSSLVKMQFRKRGQVD
jgi:hypothetical protein